MLVMKGKTFISKFATKKGNSSSKLASTAFKFYQKHKYSPSTKMQNARPEKFAPPLPPQKNRNSATKFSGPTSPNS